MKTIALTLLTLATLALAAVCVVQSRKVAQQQVQLTEQRTALEATNKVVAALQQAQAQSAERERELLRRSDEMVAQIRQETAALSNRLVKPVSTSATGGATSSDKDQSGFGSMLSKMMQDPDTKKMIQQTQRAMMDQLYGPLIKQLGLTPDEASKFKDLLADHAMKTSEQATSMFGGQGSANRTEAVSQMADLQKNMDDQIKALLGDDRYQQYQEYQKSAGERIQLNTFKQQLNSDQPLTDQQTDQLLALMKDAHQNLANSLGLPADGPGRKAAEMEMMFSDDKLQAYFDGQTQANQQVYDRAKDVLTPDQLQAFGTFQTNQLQMIRMGMTMARKMMGSQNNNGQ